MVQLSPLLLAVATSSSFFLPASARLDRRTASHRNAANSPALLTKRTPSPEPFRLFAEKSDTPSVEGTFASTHEGIVALRKRDGDDGLQLLASVGDAVGQVADAWHLAPVSEENFVEPEPVVLAAKVNEASSASKKRTAAAAVAAKKKAVAKAAKKKAASVAAKKAAHDEAVAADKAAKNAAKKAAKKAAQKAAKKAAEKSAAAASKKAAKKSAAKKASAKKVASTDQVKLATVNVGVANIDKGVSLLGYRADNCGASGATDEHPNGSLDWLNCGISKSNPNSGWTPPNGVTLARLTTVSLEHALATNSVWEPCRAYVHIFEKIASETGLPPILLASFALQESTCNPKVVGGGGEVGLMQITPDKCGGMSTEQCRNPETNIGIAARYFKQELDNQGGAFLKALGAYNGWNAGMSYDSATAARWGGCCLCQNNLDYIFQMTNGWLIGKTGYELGSYHNLKVCGYQE